MAQIIFYELKKYQVFLENANFGTVIGDIKAPIKKTDEIAGKFIRHLEEWDVSRLDDKNLVRT